MTPCFRLWVLSVGCCCSHLAASSSAVSLWTLKRKSGTRSVMIQTAGTSGPQVCGDLFFFIFLEEKFQNKSIYGGRSCKVVMEAFSVAGFPLPQEICVSYILTLVSSYQSVLQQMNKKWKTFCICIRVSMSSFSLTGRRGSGVPNWRLWQHWTQPGPKQLYASDRGDSWSVGRWAGRAWIFKEPEWFWTKKYWDPRWASTHMCGRLWLLAGD